MYPFYFLTEANYVIENISKSRISIHFWFNCAWVVPVDAQSFSSMDTPDVAIYLSLLWLLRHLHQNLFLNSAILNKSLRLNGIYFLQYVQVRTEFFFKQEYWSDLWGEEQPFLLLWNGRFQLCSSWETLQDILFLIPQG